MTDSAAPIATRQKDSWTHYLEWLFTAYIASAIILNRGETVTNSNRISLMLVLFFGIYAIRKKMALRLSVPVVSYGIFVAVALLSITWAADPSAADPLYKILPFVAVIVFVTDNLLRQLHLERGLMLGVIFGAVYNYALAFGFYVPSFNIYYWGRFIGSSANANEMAVLISLSIFASLRFLAKKVSLPYAFLNYGNICLAFYVLMLTQSRKGIVAGILFLLVYILANIKNFRLLVITVVLFSSMSLVLVRFVGVEQFGQYLALVDTRFEQIWESMQGEYVRSIEYRKHYVDLGIQLFLENPFFGVGLNNFRIHEGGSFSHSNFIELLADFGIVGFLVFYAIHFHVVKQIWRRRKTKEALTIAGSLLVLLILDVGFVSYYSRLLIIFLVYFGYKATNQDRPATGGADTVPQTAETP